MPEVPNLKAGDVVDAKVTAVKGYGVFLSHHDKSILVLAPDVSAQPSPGILESIHVGESRPVRILRINHATGQYVGTLVVDL